MAKKTVTRGEIAKITRRTDAVGAYAGKGWVQAVAFVMLLGFTIMAVLAMRTYALSMPLPDKIVGNDGKVIATAEQIQHGQELYQSRGLQQYGSVLGLVRTSVRTSPQNTCARPPMPPLINTAQKASKNRAKSLKRVASRE